MAITALPSSPSGEISHNDARLKINELVDAANLGSTGSGVVLVKSEADFPAPVGGAITLEDKTYLIEGAVVCSNRFIMGAKSILKGETSFSSTLVYTGSGTMFTATDNPFYVKDLGLVCANPTATFINHTGTKLCTFRGFYISCDGAFGSIVTSNDCIFSTGYIVLSGSGIVLAAGQTFKYFELNDCRIEQSSANPCLDVSAATITNIVVSDTQFDPQGNGASIKANGSSNYTETAVVHDCDFKLAPAQVWLDGFTVEDWVFRANEGLGVDKSKFLGSALLYNNSSSTATTAGNPTFISGIFVSGTEDQRTSVAAVTGQITNLSGKSLRPTLAAIGEITNSGGSTETYTIQFFVNAVLVPNIQSKITLNAGETKSFSILSDVFIGINQVIDIKVTTAGGGSFIIPDMQFTAKDDL